MTERLIYGLSNRTIDMFLNPYSYTRQCKPPNSTTFQIYFPNQAFENDTLIPSLNYYEVYESNVVSPSFSKILVSSVFVVGILGFIYFFTVQLINYLRLNSKKSWVQEDIKEVE